MWGRWQGAEYDNDADGVVDSLYNYTYDLAGNQTRNEYDSDADGMPNSIYNYTYDAAGNQTRYEHDSDADGMANTAAVSTFLTVGWAFIFAGEGGEA